jgi:hypothetical protein
VIGGHRTVPAKVGRECIATGKSSTQSVIVNRVSKRGTAGQIADIFPAGPSGELKPRILGPGDFHLRIQPQTLVRPAFVGHFGSYFGPPFSVRDWMAASFSPWSNRAPTV